MKNLYNNQIKRVYPVKLNEQQLKELIAQSVKEEGFELEGDLTYIYASRNATSNDTITMIDPSLTDKVNKAEKHEEQYIKHIEFNISEKAARVELDVETIGDKKSSNNSNSKLKYFFIEVLMRIINFDGTVDVKQLERQGFKYDEKKSQELTLMFRTSKRLMLYTNTDGSNVLITPHKDSSGMFTDDKYIIIATNINTLED